MSKALKIKIGNKTSLVITRIGTTRIATTITGTIAKTIKIAKTTIMGNATKTIGKRDEKTKGNKTRNAQSSQRHCSHCKKFGHTIAQCWFRPQNRQSPQLPLQQNSNYQPNRHFPNLHSLNLR